MSPDLTEPASETDDPRVHPTASWRSRRLPRPDGTIARPRFIAFYLPQFHPIAENDQWWGQGFTEWTSVTKARPRFRGHDQPRLPADLGFYDLRVPEVARAQAELARRYSIDAFCYYHYWFNGRRLLEAPFNRMLDSGDPDFPFCLCWANEDWTRQWDGASGQILMKQTYGPEDDRRHARSLLKAWHDPRHVRVDGKPLFLVYRASRLPDPLRFSEIWREEAARGGLDDLYLCKVESFPSEYDDPRKIGFDASVLFQPRAGLAESSFRWQWRAVARKVGLLRGDAGRPRVNVMPYAQLMERALSMPQPSYPSFPGIAPGWDNTPRRRFDAFLLSGATPGLYGQWLRSLCAQTNAGLVFITAWNEWAEGSYLEPDRRWGRRYPWRLTQRS